MAVLLLFTECRARLYDSQMKPIVRFTCLTKRGGKHAEHERLCATCAPAETIEAMVAEGWEVTPTGMQLKEAAAQ